MIFKGKTNKKIKKSYFIFLFLKNVSRKCWDNQTIKQARRNVRKIKCLFAKIPLTPSNKKQKR